jgi:hypothetical protein
MKYPALRAIMKDIETISDLRAAIKQAAEIWVTVVINRDGTVWFRVSKAEALRSLHDWEPEGDARAVWSTSEAGLLIIG